MTHVTGHDGVVVGRNRLLQTGADEVQRFILRHATSCQGERNGGTKYA